jgi:hypothetical protein
VHSSALSADASILRGSWSSSTDITDAPRAVSSSAGLTVLTAGGTAAFTLIARDKYGNLVNTSDSSEIFLGEFLQPLICPLVVGLFLVLFAALNRDRFPKSLAGAIKYIDAESIFTGDDSSRGRGLVMMEQRASIYDNNQTIQNISAVGDVISSLVFTGRYTEVGRVRVDIGMLTGAFLCDPFVRNC